MLSRVSTQAGRTLWALCALGQRTSGGHCVDRGRSSEPKTSASITAGLEGRWGQRKRSRPGALWTLVGFWGVGGLSTVL